MISQIEMILSDVILLLMTYQIHFHFSLRGTSLACSNFKGFEIEI